MSKQEGTKHIPGITLVTIIENKGVKGEKKFKEIFEKAKYNRKGVCPVRDVIARISDKWSILVILALGGNGKMRFNEIKHQIGDVSQRMLTVTLRHLEEDGLVTREIFAQVPPRVEYELTEVGHGLMEQISILADWADVHSEAILKSRKKEQKRSLL